MVLFQVPSAASAVNVSAVRGWIHHTPTLLLAKSTICAPAGTPSARPAIGAVLSGPPAAIGGTAVKATEGGCRARPQALMHAARQTIVSETAARRTRSTG